MTKIDWKRSLQQAGTSQGKPLQIIASPRFHFITFRAKRRRRIVPSKSNRSSFSSASIVSSSYLKSPEPDLRKQLQTDKTSRRQCFLGLAVTLVVLLIIGITLSIVLPVTLIKHSVDNNTTNTTSDIPAT